MALKNKGNKNSNQGFPQNLYNKHAWILGNPEIGENVWIGAFTLIDAKYAKLTIGKGCNISCGAQILTHSTVRRTISEGKIGVDFAPVEIGEYCFIGTNAVILKGTKIGHHSVIAAGCVVTEDTVIPSFSIVAGIPGKVISSSKKYTEKP